MISLNFLNRALVALPLILLTIFNLKMRTLLNLIGLYFLNLIFFFYNKTINFLFIKCLERSSVTDLVLLALRLLREDIQEVVDSIELVKP